ncbi:unnamed protein product [Trichogramma brassicae]|uniref:Uncharacterized protein n=1 Tax=Trichogramma brassicae TaxID=86971 RepID=A0A6H5J3Z7_9HYME|nr:unnamed protein product [Trichogramma brassicae]
MQDSLLQLHTHSGGASHTHAPTRSTTANASIETNAGIRRCQVNSKSNELYLIANKNICRQIPTYERAQIVHLPQKLCRNSGLSHLALSICSHSSVSPYLSTLLIKGRTLAIETKSFATCTRVSIFLKNINWTRTNITRAKLSAVSLRTSEELENAFKLFAKILRESIDKATITENSPDMHRRTSTIIVRKIIEKKNSQGMAKKPKYHNKSELKQNKSAHITFTLRRETCPQVFLYDSPIPVSDQVKYLGLHLDRCLTWRAQIWSKRKQLGIKLRSLYQLIGRNSALSLDHKVLLYKAILKADLDVRFSALGQSGKLKYSSDRAFSDQGSSMFGGRTWYVPNEVIRGNLRIPTTREGINECRKKHGCSLFIITVCINLIAYAAVCSRICKSKFIMESSCKRVRSNPEKKKISCEKAPRSFQGVPRCRADRPKREPSQASHRCFVRCPHELQSLGPVQSSGHPCFQEHHLNSPSKIGPLLHQHLLQPRGTRLDLPTVLNSVIVEHSNASPSVGPCQDHRFISDSDSDDERYLRFRAERPDTERSLSERLRSIVVVPPGSGLIRHEELACQRHPTRPELCVPPVRAPRAESPGLRQPIPRKPRGRSLSPYLRENSPVPPHLHRSIKIRLNAPVTARIRPRVRTPPRSPILPAKRHFGLAFISKSSPPRHSALSRLGPPVTAQPPLKVLTPPTSPAKPTTASTRRKEQNHRRTLARRKLREAE